MLFFWTCTSAESWIKKLAKMQSHSSAGCTDCWHMGHLLCGGLPNNQSSTQGLWYTCLHRKWRTISLAVKSCWQTAQVVLYASFMMPSSKDVIVISCDTSLILSRVNNCACVVPYESYRFTWNGSSVSSWLRLMITLTQLLQHSKHQMPHMITCTNSAIPNILIHINIIVMLRCPTTTQNSAGMSSK